MPNTFDCDRGFISKLLQTKDLVTVKDARINASFLSGDSRAAFKYIYDKAIETGAVPSVRAFKRKFPHYELETVYDERTDDEVVGTEETLLFWCSELREKKKHNTIAEATEEIAQNIEDYDAKAAYIKMKKTIAYIESEVEETHDIDIADNPQARIEVYKKRKKSQGMEGLPTGIEHLDFIMRGLAPQTLTTLIANTGVGKTWLEVLIGSYLVLEGHRVTHFITEMSDNQMRDRYEAMMYSMLHGNISYNQLKRGLLDRKTERSFFRFLSEDLPEYEGLLKIITATSPIGVSADIEKYKPDVALIDGVYLMDDDEGADSDWLRVAHITRDLKKITKRAGTPIFINSQADKNTSKKTGPELGSISYSQAIGMDSDNVLSLFRDQTMIADQEMCIKVLKQREGELGRVFIQWDFDRMKFNSIYTERESGDSNEVEIPTGDVKSKNTLDVMEDE